MEPTELELAYAVVLLGAMVEAQPHQQETLVDILHQKVTMVEQKMVVQVVVAVAVLVEQVESLLEQVQVLFQEPVVLVAMQTHRGQPLHQLV
jgi:hypothetical protein